MNRVELKTALDGMLESLAAIEHERWSHWQKYMHGKANHLEDGSLSLPSDLVQRWEKQMNTPYGALSDVEKESDREQVKRYLNTIVEALSQKSSA